VTVAAEKLTPGGVPTTPLLEERISCVDAGTGLVRGKPGMEEEAQNAIEDAGLKWCSVCGEDVNLQVDED
jgi:hypothetical protein